MMKAPPRPRFYVLDGHTPRPTNDVLEWARLVEDDDKRIVQQDQFEEGWLVSTVFLGLDHNYFGEGPPLLFETMILGPFGPIRSTSPGAPRAESHYQRRYATWEEAERGHALAVEQVHTWREEEP